MKLEQINVTIRTDGKIHLKTTGFSGDECMAVTKELEEILGNLIITRDTTSEFYDTVTNQNTEKLKIRH